MMDAVGVMYWTGHSMRHFIPTVAAAIDIGKEQRDYVGRWHVNLHQSADYVHTSRQIVTKVQEAVNRSLCEGNPNYDESELMEDYGCFLVTKGRSHTEWIKPHAVWKKVGDSIQVGGKWPTMDVDVIDSEIWAEQPTQIAGDEAENVAAVESTGEDENKAPAFFVTVSRHTGFRRLHKVGCCGTHPWTCHKVEYVSRVVDGIADAVCKTCKRASGKEIDKEESSSSGSSSSTDMDAGVSNENTEAD